MCLFDESRNRVLKYEEQITNNHLLIAYLSKK